MAPTASQSMLVMPAFISASGGSSGRIALRKLNRFDYACQSRRACTHANNRRHTYIATTLPTQYPVLRKMETAFRSPFMAVLQSSQVQNAAV